MSAPLADYYDCPSGARWTVASDPRRCWMCSFYSFKNYAGKNDSAGKCFRDFASNNRRLYWVNGLMTCPGFVHDGTAE